MSDDRTGLDFGPPCRVCGKKQSVAISDPNRPQEAICPECCGAGAEHADGETGHVWKYERAERDHVCQECGISMHGDEDGGISDRERI